MQHPNAPAQQYRAIVFRQMPATPDFTRSEKIVLPGQHTAEAAWQEVRIALRAGRPDLIGGEIEPCG